MLLDCDVTIRENSIIVCHFEANIELIHSVGGSFLQRHMFNGRKSKKSATKKPTETKHAKYFKKIFVHFRVYAGIFASLFYLWSQFVDEIFRKRLGVVIF